ncbi:MAG: nucleotidyltransferase domain-containing protein [Firmicutes bacterium]|nr:nucleotidyltransferase domain-containing protein [Bacillota bacterium]
MKQKENAVYDLPALCEAGLIEAAKKYDIHRLILFGSRARAGAFERSDVDIAVLGGDADGFCFDIEESVDTLLSFDVVDMSETLSDKLKSEIEKDGVILYEKIR